MPAVASGTRSRLARVEALQEPPRFFPPPRWQRLPHYCRHSRLGPVGHPFNRVCQVLAPRTRLGVALCGLELAQRYVVLGLRPLVFHRLELGVRRPTETSVLMVIVDDPRLAMRSRRSCSGAWDLYRIWS